MGLAGGLGLDARLGRPRRGRADAPADRALRVAARDPAAVGDPPRRRERDQPGVARGAGARGRAGGAAALAPGRRDARSLRARGRGGARARRVRAVGLDPRRRARTTPRARADPDLHRRRGAADARGRAESWPGEGTRVRVVSMPCIELFEAQTQEYRDSVLPRPTTARLAVEPGASMSWWKWVGSDGDVLGLDRFGASAPGTKVLEELGLHRREHRARARGCAVWRRRKGIDLQMRTSSAASEFICCSARPERVDRLPLARIDPRGSPAAPDRRGLRGRSHLEPDDLPEGDDGGERLRRAAAQRGRAGEQRQRRRSGRWPSATSKTPAICSARSGMGAPAATGTSRWRSTRAWPTTRSRPTAKRSACTRPSTAPT